MVVYFCFVLIFYLLFCSVLFGLFFVLRDLNLNYLTKTQKEKIEISVSDLHYMLITVEKIAFESSLPRVSELELASAVF